jgi:hypothetical protein
MCVDELSRKHIDTYEDHCLALFVALPAWIVMLSKLIKVAPNAHNFSIN